MSSEKVIKIPVGAMGYIVEPGTGGQAGVSDENGLGNWTQLDTVVRIYFHLSQTGEFDFGFVMKVPGVGVSKIQVKFENQIKEIEVEGAEFHSVPVGRFNSTCGCKYESIEIQALSKTIYYIGEISHIEISGYEGEVGWATDGRRNGPSVHLNYKIEDDKVEYFYNEVTVPEGNDRIHAYFCVIGFYGGYTGIQVNSETERRILFSIWSAYDTQDPKQIPEEYTVKLLEKGEDTIPDTFGHEGSGSNSRIVFPWKTGVTYQFLVRASPDAATNSTTFSAWYFDSGEWKLVARFLRPKSQLWLSSVYSFSEDFDGNMGWQERKAYFGNQWFRDNEGYWKQVKKACFNADASGQKGCRIDYAGGVENDKFYLRNCGFFDDNVEIGTDLERECGTTTPPQIDLEKLP